MYLRSSWVLSWDDFPTVADGSAPQLGHGGFGTVFKAPFPIGSDHHVAVKRLGAGEQLFSREACLGLALRCHPNVIRCLGVLEAPPASAIVMELVPAGNDRDGAGASLHDWITANLTNEQLRVSPMSTHVLLTLAVQICRGLSHVHDSGWIHCDVKPMNVLIDGSGSARVCDFGCAAEVTEADGVSAVRWPGTGGGAVTSVSRSIGGTVGYLAPERLVFLRNESGAMGTMACQASDVWSFGVLLLQLFYGSTTLQCLARECCTAPTVVRPYVMVSTAPSRTPSQTRMQNKPPLTLMTCVFML